MYKIQSALFSKCFLNLHFPKLKKIISLIILGREISTVASDVSLLMLITVETSIFHGTILPCMAWSQRRQYLYVLT